MEKRNNLRHTHSMIECYAYVVWRNVGVIDGCVEFVQQKSKKLRVRVYYYVSVVYVCVRVRYITYIQRWHVYRANPIIYILTYKRIKTTVRYKVI